MPHDIYQLPEYARFSAFHEGGEPAAFVSEHDGALLFVPLIIMPLPAYMGTPEAWGMRAALRGTRHRSRCPERRRTFSRS